MNTKDQAVDDAIRGLSAAGTELIFAYREAVKVGGEHWALALTVRLIQSVIKNEKVRTTDILEAIRQAEAADDDVLHG